MDSVDDTTYASLIEFALESRPVARALPPIVDEHLVFETLDGDRTAATLAALLAEYQSAWEAGDRTALLGALALIGTTRPLPCWTLDGLTEMVVENLRRQPANRTRTVLTQWQARVEDYIRWLEVQRLDARGICTAAAYRIVAEARGRATDAALTADAVRKSCVRVAKDPSGAAAIFLLAVLQRQPNRKKRNA